MFLAGKTKLTGREAKGLELFNGKGNCNLCHVSNGFRPLYTDFSYDNLGVPKNPDNLFYNMDEVFLDGKAINPEGANWIDPGLGGFLSSIGDPTATENMGKQKVPTLRNVDVKRLA